ncbi:MAG: AAA family ATPase, partial [Synergistaceae bacterium]|nr:AAA family ATPase [Synergistaceae bacterium]
MILKGVLESVKADYDLVLLDTLVAFDIMTLNALSASTGVILPAQADILSLNALKDSYDLIQ